MLPWNRERLLSSLDSGHLLPSFSPLIVQLINVCSSENSSSKDIAALIEKDPSLTIAFSDSPTEPFTGRVIGH